MATDNTTITITPITSEFDFLPAFQCAANAFGHQIHDTLWTLLHPGWDTPDGASACAARLAQRWKKTTKNRNGDPNTVFLKAEVSEPGSDSPVIAGMAIWQQASFDPSWGDAPLAGMPKSDLDLLPSESDKRFANQAFASLFRKRVEVVKEKEGQEIPATFVLDLCAVDPKYQRRGIAQKLVQWGLNEAKRRGGLECTTEASSMGRGAYRKLGFRDEGKGDIVYEVDEEFRGREMPPNVFLRTGGK